jgi:hypothetical protein
MVRLRLENVSIDYPVFGARAGSLKTTLAKAATGGRIGRDAGVTVVQALRVICLDLREGDRLGVVGHNGAGKSTLLQTLAGVYPPSCGSYHRQGSVASLINPMLGIELDATGYENIVIRGLVLGMGRASIRRLTPEIADFSGLGDYLTMPVRTYSTGMMMRLTFDSESPTSWAISRCFRPSAFSFRTWISFSSLRLLTIQAPSTKAASKDSALSPEKPRDFSKWTSNRAPSWPPTAWVCFPCRSASG